jgi:hypothetical protein
MRDTMFSPHRTCTQLSLNAQFVVLLLACVPSMKVNERLRLTRLMVSVVITTSGLKRMGYEFGGLIESDPGN